MGEGDGSGKGGQRNGEGERVEWTGNMVDGPFEMFLVSRRKKTLLYGVYIG